MTNSGVGNRESRVGSKRTVRSVPTPDPRLSYNPPMADQDADDKAKTKKPMDKARLRAILKDAGEIIWRSRARLAIGIPLLLVNRLSSIVLPYMSKLLYDDVIAKGHVDLLPKLVLVSLGVAIFGGTTDYALAQILGIAAQRSITDLRTRLQQHVQRLPIRYFDSTKTGVLVSRVMNDAEGIRNLVGTGLAQIFGGIVTAGLATAFLFRLNARLASLVFLAFFAFAGILFWAFSTARPMFKQRGAVYADVTGRLTEGFSGIRIVKAYTAEEHEEKVFDQGARKLLNLIVGTMRTISTAGAMTTFLVGVVSAVVMYVGGRAVVAHNAAVAAHGSPLVGMTPGDLIAFTLYLALVIGPVVQIVSIGTQLSEAFAGLERMREIFNETREDDLDSAKTTTPDIAGTIEFRNVGFEYTPGVPVLKNINLVAPAGKSIALVGPSGSGKSTMISLIAAFHHPTQGEILVDGKPMNDLRLADYRSHLGIVPQDSFLFAESIYDNIVLGNPQASREEVLQAAHIAHVDEFTEAFADKYDTIVGERGVRLSGGQKQRVAIARAIVANPRILILDEATSSLDSESEAMIQDGLNSLMKGRTTFVIAHRLSTIRNADQILVLENGEITERGTHQELMLLGGRYRKLYEKQYGVMVNRFVNEGEELRDLAAKV
jgi:ABC-type multidrug transport system fused ATPase/permease subunit